MSLESSSSSTNSILNSLSDIDSSSFTESSNLNSNSNSILSFFQSIPWTIWVLLIIVLAFLGFNIFSYLAVGTQDVASLFSNISSKFAELLGTTVSKTVDVSAAGATGVVNVVENTIEQAIPQIASSSQQPSTVEKQVQEQENTLNKALNNAEQNIPTGQVEADDSYSSIQMNKSTGKSGWCYIGEDRGFRSCMEVGPNDQCMSGDIFPTSAVCVNPNLRV
jgi:hypothetical protein